MEKAETDLLIDSLKTEGKMVILGVPDVTKGITFDALKLVLWHRSLEGSIVGSISDSENMLKFSALHNVLPINEHFTFDTLDKAF